MDGIPGIQLIDYIEYKSTTKTGDSKKIKFAKSSFDGFKKAVKGRIEKSRRYNYDNKSQEVSNSTNLGFVEDLKKVYTKIVNIDLFRKRQVVSSSPKAIKLKQSFIENINHKINILSGEKSNNYVDLSHFDIENNKYDTYRKNYEELKAEQPYVKNELESINLNSTSISENDEQKDNIYDEDAISRILKDAEIKRDDASQKSANDDYGWIRNDATMRSKSSNIINSANEDISFSGKQRDLSELNPREIFKRRTESYTDENFDAKKQSLNNGVLNNINDLFETIDSALNPDEQKEFYILLNKITLTKINDINNKTSDEMEKNENVRNLYY